MNYKRCYVIYCAICIEWFKKDRESLLAIIAKYGILIREWGGLYYALLEIPMNKIGSWKNVCVEEWTA